MLIAILDGPERPSAELPPLWAILMSPQLPAQLLPEDDPVGAAVKVLRYRCFIRREKGRKDVQNMARNTILPYFLCQRLRRLCFMRKREEWERKIILKVTYLWVQSQFLQAQQLAI
jgi:hypothetical protein